MTAASPRTASPRFAPQRNVFSMNYTIQFDHAEYDRLNAADQKPKRRKWAPPEAVSEGQQRFQTGEQIPFSDVPPLRFAAHRFAPQRPATFFSSSETIDFQEP